ncbi:uncharacterized protein METZ01_LOCUS308833 [marine metagenome]|uniref:Uncharacterized protein n=1 Tax=marine metagenome TaxID=408172 RepID=A0A382N474_9ZZZZ
MNVQITTQRNFVLPVEPDHFIDHINSHGPISNTDTASSLSIAINLI